jgi:hypothetical protein
VAEVEVLTMLVHQPLSIAGFGQRPPPSGLALDVSRHNLIARWIDRRPVEMFVRECES